MLHESEPTITLCSDATKRFLLAAKHAEITVLEQLSSNCRIVIAVRELIHELQNRWTDTSFCPNQSEAEG